MKFLQIALVVAAASGVVAIARPARVGGAGSGGSRVTLHVEGMTCPSCKAVVRIAIGRLPGVTDAKVDVARESATVEYDASRVSPQQMVDAVSRLGYQASLPATGGLPPHATRAEAPPGVEARAVKAGEPAPAFSLPAADGSRWALKEALARGPAVLVFNRGDW